MGEPNTSLLGQRVLVLSAHRVLRQAIKLGLRYRLRMDVVETSALPDGLDLVVATALSFVEQESVPPSPVLGHVPLLIISDRPLDPKLDIEGVFHLGFPFSYEDLYAKTAEILRPTSCVPHPASGASRDLRGGNVDG